MASFANKIAHRVLSTVKCWTHRRSAFVMIADTKLDLDLKSSHERSYLVAPRATVDYAVAKALPLAGKRVLDLGANIGLTALYYLECGAASVDAVEPVPQLATRIRNLGTDKIVLHELAISDSIGTQVLHLSDKHNQGHSLSDQWPKLFPEVFAQSRKTEVTTTTLDAHFAGKTFDFIKIDVEGVELQVIRGGIGFFEANKASVLQIELYRDRFAEADQILHEIYPVRKRIIYSGGVALLVAIDSPALTRFKDEEINPPNYLYCAEVPAGIKVLD
jgi:FkbM family methyltransferase